MPVIFESFGLQQAACMSISPPLIYKCLTFLNSLLSQQKGMEYLPIVRDIQCENIPSLTSTAFSGVDGNIAG